MQTQIVLELNTVGFNGIGSREPWLNHHKNGNYKPPYIKEWEINTNNTLHRKFGMSQTTNTVYTPPIHTHTAY